MVVSGGAGVLSSVHVQPGPNPNFFCQNNAFQITPMTPLRVDPKTASAVITSNTGGTMLTNIKCARQPNANDIQTLANCGIDGSGSMVFSLQPVRTGQENLGNLNVHAKPSFYNVLQGGTVFGCATESSAVFRYDGHEGDSVDRPLVTVNGVGCAVVEKKDDKVIVRSTVLDGSADAKIYIITKDIKKTKNVPGTKSTRRVLYMCNTGAGGHYRVTGETKKKDGAEGGGVEEMFSDIELLIISVNEETVAAVDNALMKLENMHNQLKDPKGGKKKKDLAEVIKVTISAISKVLDAKAIYTLASKGDGCKTMWETVRDKFDIKGEFDMQVGGSTGVVRLHKLESLKDLTDPFASIEDSVVNTMKDNIEKFEGYDLFGKLKELLCLWYTTVDGVPSGDVLPLVEHAFSITAAIQKALAFESNELSGEEDTALFGNDESPEVDAMRGLFGRAPKRKSCQRTGADSDNEFERPDASDPLDECSVQVSQASHWKKLTTASKRELKNDTSVNNNLAIHCVVTSKSPGQEYRVSNDSDGNTFVFMAEDPSTPIFVFDKNTPQSSACPTGTVRGTDDGNVIFSFAHTEVKKSIAFLSNKYN